MAAIMEKHDVSVTHNENSSGSSLSGSSPALTDPVRTRRIVRAIDLRLLPLCAWIYLLNYLDRGNIGNARVLNSETQDSLVQVARITPTQYAIVLSMFSLAYAVFEVPSNWIMKRYVKPSLWLSILLLGWGAATLAFTGVQNYVQTLILRILIGIFEAGFFPAIVYLITFWYRPNERSIRISVIMASATLAGAFGGCIAYGMGHLNGKAGLEGFRWLFLIEGLISVVSCLLLVFFMPNFPSTAKFLSAEDRVFAVDRLEGLGYTKQHATKRENLETCFNPRMLAHYFIYLLDCIPLGSLTFYTPTIVAGLGYNSITAQLMTVPPWVVAYLASLILSWSADRLNARGFHIATASTIGGIGWLTAALLPANAYKTRYGALVLCACGAFPSAAPLSSWVSCNAPAVAGVGIAIALNNSSAGIAQMIAQWIWRAQEAKIGYPTGNIVCAACSFGTAAGALGLRWWYGRMNKVGAKDASGKDRVWML